MTEIPTPWPLRPLAELILSLRNGVFVSRPGTNPPGIPIFRISAVRPMRLDVDDFRYANIDESKAAGYFVDEGDLLFTRYSGNPEFVGACARVPRLHDRRLHPDKLIRVVVDRDVVDPRFIELAVSAGSGRQQIEQRLKTTAGQVGIAGSQLKSVLLPVPTLNEQRRIVDVIEEQFSRLDDAEASLDRAVLGLEHLRQAVFLAAVGGWPSVELGTVVSDLRYGTSVKCSYEAEGLPILRIPNIQHGRVDLTDLKFATAAVDLTKVGVASGDLLFVRTNGSRDLIGRVAAVGSIEGVGYASYLIRGTPDQTNLVPRYAVIALSSPGLRRAIEMRAATTAGQYNLNQRSIASLPIPLPPFDEQVRLVHEFDRMETLIDGMRSEVQKAKLRCRTLRQATMRQAFTRRPGEGGGS